MKTLLGLSHSDECQWYRVVPGSIFLVFLLQLHLAQQFIDNSRRKRHFMQLMGVIRLQIGNALIFHTANQNPFDFNSSLLTAVVYNDTETALFLLNHIKVSVNITLGRSPVIFRDEVFKTLHKAKKLHCLYIELLKLFETRINRAINEDCIISLQQLVEKLQDNSKSYNFSNLKLANTTDTFLQCIKP